MPAVVAKLTAQPGKRDEMIEVLRSMIDHTATEPGTLAYIMHTIADDPDSVLFYEDYTDQAAFDAHSKSDAMRSAGKALAGILAGRPQLTFLEVVGRKGA